MATNRFVYFIEAVGLNAIKIGVAEDVNHRLMQLQCASPAELRIVDFVPGDSRLEKSIHKKLRHLHIRGEWFANTVEIKDTLIALQGGAFSGMEPRNLRRVFTGVRILKRAGRKCYQVEWRDAVTGRFHAKSTGETSKNRAQAAANKVLTEYIATKAKEHQPHEDEWGLDGSIGKYEHVC